MVDKVRRQLAERSIGIDLTQAALDWLVDEGFDPVYGARPLRRAVERHVENEVARRILGRRMSGWRYGYRRRRGRAAHLRQQRIARARVCEGVTLPQTETFA